MRYLLIIGLLIQAELLWAIDILPGMKVYSQLDGYPAGVGYQLNQDPKGFIWVGTDQGAVRFDGRHFRLFDQKDGLKDKEILEAIPDHHGRVFFIPVLNNISCYRNGRMDTSMDFSIIRNKQLNQAWLDPVSGNIWFADSECHGDVYHLDHDSIVRIDIPIPQPFGLKAVFDQRLYLELQLEEQLLTLAVYDLKDQHFQVLKDEQSRPIRSDGFVFSPDRKYVAALHNEQKELGIYQLQGFNVSLLQTIHISKRIREIYLDHNNHLWLLPWDKGLEYWGDVKELNTDSRPWSVLEQSVINDVLVDRENNVWITTKHEGLLFISLRHWKNAALLSRMNLLHYLPQSISTDKQGRLYIGHLLRSRVAVVDQGHTTFIEMQDDHSGIHGMARLQEHMGLYNASNFYLLDDRLQIKKFSTFHAIKDAVPYGDSDILLATHSTVLWCYTKGNGFDFVPVFHQRSTCIAVEEDSSILVGTPSGLYIKNNMDSEAYLIQDPVLAEAHITDVTIAGRYTLIGTVQRGLYAYDRHSGMVRNVLNKGKTGVSFIRKIYMENDSTCWLATDQGVYTFVMDSSLQPSELGTFSFYDGIPSQNVIDIAVIADTIYVTTPSGLGIIIRGASSPAIVNRPLAWIVSAESEYQQAFFPERIELPYNDNNLQLLLSAITYESLGNVHFRYQLEGISKRWIQTAGPALNIGGMSAGKYTLRVLAVNHNGQVSGQPATLEIIVYPAFWQTWWFRSLVIFIVLLIVAGMVYYLALRSRNKRMEQAHQQVKLAVLELEAIKAQINPHFIYNCLNSIQYFIYKDHSETAKEYLNLFSRLIRQTMQYSQQTFITLKEETEYLCNYLELEKMRFKDQLNYVLEVDESIKSNRLVPAMLVQPYLENAIKHGIAKIKKAGELRVAFSEATNGWLLISIQDNGPGLPVDWKKEQKKTLGMRLSGSRTEIYNQLFKLEMKVRFKTVSFASENGSGGTCVEILIPPITNEISSLYSIDR